MSSRSGLARCRAERQQSHLAGVLDGDRDVALVLHAITGDPAGTDLPALADVGPQQRGVLVVDDRVLALLGAERALASLDRLLWGRTPLRGGGLSHMPISFSMLMRPGGKPDGPRESTGQNGGSSSAPLNEPDAGALPHGSSLGASLLAGRDPPPPPPPKPPPPPPLRLALLTLAVAYFSDGPISSTSSSTTVRFSPSRVSNERCLSRPLTITLDPRTRLSATFSAASRQMLQRRNSASPSFHSLV